MPLRRTDARQDARRVGQSMPAAGSVVRPEHLKMTRLSAVKALWMAHAGVQAACWRELNAMQVPNGEVRPGHQFDQQLAILRVAWV